MSEESITLQSEALQQQGTFKEVSYKVIGSGSKGNCVVIGDVMFDCGLPFKKLKDHLYDIKYLILTHTHTDHIKESTLNRIKQLFPKITIIGNHEVQYLYGVDIVANAGYPVITPDYTFHPFEVKHDVLCYGYHFELQGLNTLYCTDAAEMPEFDTNFDMFFLESNHDTKKLQVAARSKRFGYNILYGASRHLSNDQAKAFYYMHRVGKDSLWIELHKSERFY